jgi:sugar phosphate isomerase/epimerase
MRERPLGMIVPVQDKTPFSPFAPENWKQALRRVRTAGYDGVELAITNPVLIKSDTIKGVLEAEGLRLLSITTGQVAGLEGLSLTSPNERIRRLAIERIAAHMDLAQRFGAVVIVGSLRGADGDIEILIESLRECATHAPQVRLALEPLNRYESRLVNTVAEGLEVVERVATENIGLLADTFHANIEEVSIGEAFRAASDRLFHVHLADSNRWVPGFGHLPFAEVWTALDVINYAGGLVIEAFPCPSAEALLASLATIKRQWSKGGLYGV